MGGEGIQKAALQMALELSGSVDWISAKGRDAQAEGGPDSWEATGPFDQSRDCI